MPMPAQAPYGQQMPMQMPPQQTYSTQAAPMQGVPPMPGLTPPQPQKSTKLLPSQKKKRILYVLLVALITTAIATIVTGVYFYLTYVVK